MSASAGCLLRAPRRPSSFQAREAAANILRCCRGHTAAVVKVSAASTACYFGSPALPAAGQTVSQLSTFYKFFQRRFQKKHAVFFTTQTVTTKDPSSARDETHLHGGGTEAGATAANTSTLLMEECGEQVTLFAELSGMHLTGPLSGRRLQQLATAAAARGIRDPRVWACFSARAIELNGLTISTSKATHTTEAASSGSGDSRAGEAGEEEIGCNTAEESAQRPLRDGIESARGFRHFEALRFLSAFLSAGFKDTGLLLSFDQIFLRQLHAFECRHLLQLLYICEQHKYRSRRLYTPLFKTLAARAPSLLFQEIADVFCCFAAHRIGSSSCCLSLLKAAAAQVPNSNLSDCIRVCGALHALGIARDSSVLTEEALVAHKGTAAEGSATTAATVEEAAVTVLALIDQRTAFLVEGLPLQLLLDEVQMLPRLEFSWRPYEELADKFLMKRLAKLEQAEDVEQLADPFATLQFIRARGSEHEAFLKAMIRWCGTAAHKPATRSQKRPTAEELVMLHDACREHGLANDERLQKAILKFVSTDGGTARRPRFVSPLEYQRNRRYFYLPDLRAGHTPAIS